MRMHRPSLRPPPDVLHLYSAAVSALAEELRPLQLPVYCLPASALDRAATVAQPQPASPLTGRGSDAPASAADVARPGLAATRGASLEQPDVRLSSTAQERLRTQRQLQDDLAGELLGMGAELKASTLAMQSAIRCGWCAGGRLPHCLAPQAAQHQSLPPPHTHHPSPAPCRRYRGKLLDEAESALVDSAANAHAVASKAKEQHRRGRWGLCQTLVLLLATALIFCAMVVWIKLTSMAGLGRRPRG